MRCPKCKEKMECVSQEIVKAEGKQTFRFECIICPKEENANKD